MSRSAFPWLLFGATGAVGGHVLARLAARGEGVLAVSRERQADADGVRWAQGDVFVPSPDLGRSIARQASGDWPPAVISAGPLDGFVDWAMRQPLPAGLRIVALSSMSAETKRDAGDPAERALAARLQRAETALLEAAGTRGWAVTLLRPTLIWGAGLDRSLSPLVRLSRRTRLLPLPRGSNGLRQPVHAEDLAVALIRACNRPELAGATLSLPGGETLGFADMLRRSLAAAAPGARVVQLPDALFAPVLAALRRGSPRMRAAANALARSRCDLVVTDPGWHRLGLTPRAFTPSVEAFVAAGS